VSRPRRSRRSQEKFNGVRLKFTGLSGEPMVDCATVSSKIGGATRGPHQRSEGGTGLSGVHRTLSGAPTDAEVQRLSAPEKEGDRHRTVYSDCPVCHPTEGKISLPRLSPTAPSCLGAIKGTPRRMEDSPRLTRKILRLQDSILTHSIL
jgi:hypothetical protein